VHLRGTEDMAMEHRDVQQDPSSQPPHFQLNGNVRLLSRECPLSRVSILSVEDQEARFLAYYMEAERQHELRELAWLK
jgi:hypothetical protein